MSDANDDAQNYALAVIAAVVALVIAGVLTLSISRSGPPKAPKAPAQAAAAPAAAAAPRVYFEVDSDALPGDAAELLARVAEEARAKPGAAVLISGFHDASGDPEHNADLAKRRAQAVRHALEANGVAPAQLVLDKPQQTLGGGDAREARRVELRIQ
ncbi:OmpA family protein [Piscinibacter sp.]|mgnify:FL=1|uniref:OmpA family protein n=1 Tax=Piscinibacter sp. TaxID=1903157 RepID=UPI001B57A5FD|nr:OmpA family protein [Piscinibacter sp.]MBP5988733.1 OmpA family protein [Piscinibacter sp.]MBP6025778.1 OmpA family protein [Piscinibacter sp.]